MSEAYDNLFLGLGLIYDGTNTSMTMPQAGSLKNQMGTYVTVYLGVVV